MPVVVTCPHCGKMLRATEELLGKRVRCASCKQTFTASTTQEPAPRPPRSPEAALPRSPEAPARPSSGSSSVRRAPVSRRPPPPEEDEYDAEGEEVTDDDADPDDEDIEESEPLRRDEHENEGFFSPRTAREGWKKTRQGINFVILSVWITLGAIVLMVCGGILAGAVGAGLAAQNPNNMVAAGIGVLAVMGFGVFVIFAATVLRIVGHIFCLGVPARPPSAAQALAIAVLAAAGGQIVLTVLSMAVSMASVGFAPRTMTGSFGFSATSGFAMVLSVLGSIASIGYIVLFPLFLRSLAAAVKAKSLVSQLTGFLIGEGVLIGLYVLLLIVATLVNKPTGPPGMGTVPPERSAAALVSAGIGCIVGLGGLVLMVWFIVLLYQSRGAVERQLRKANRA